MYDNKDITRNFVGGVDFNTGSFSHAIRFSYLKFQNQIKDATIGSTTLPFANLGAEIFDGSDRLVARPESLGPAEHSAKRPSNQVRWQQNPRLRT